jgi:predicted amidophosphoribosyltransferase
MSNNKPSWLERTRDAAARKQQQLREARDAATAAQPSQPSTTGALPTCRHCGAPATGSPFCSECGAPADTAGPLRSPDGRFWWDGQTWKPVATEVRQFQQVTHVQTRLVRRNRMSDGAKTVHIILCVLTAGLWAPIFWIHWKASFGVVEEPIVYER